MEPAEKIKRKKEYFRKYMKEYLQRPEVKQRIKKYLQRPEVKQRIKKYNQSLRRKQIVKESYQKNKEKIKQYKKEYLQRPEVKQRRKESRKNYKKINKERIRLQQKEYSQRPKVKQYKKEYLQRPEVKQRIKDRHFERRKNDNVFRVKSLLRKRLGFILNKYLRTGKIMTANKYGIDYAAIIEHLKPFPEDISKYHIDHIKPLCSFNFENPEEIKKAFAPGNHQWLTVHENLSKGGRY